MRRAKCQHGNLKDQWEEEADKKTTIKVCCWRESKLQVYSGRQMVLHANTQRFTVGCYFRTHQEVEPQQRFTLKSLLLSVQVSGNARWLFTPTVTLYSCFRLYGRMWKHLFLQRQAEKCESGSLLFDWSNQWPVLSFKRAENSNET